jgi:hypothetical protein
VNNQVKIHYYAAVLENDPWVKYGDSGEIYARLRVEDTKALSENEQVLLEKLKSFAKDNALTVKSGVIPVKLQDRSADARLETKAKIRTSRMEARAQEKNPLFAQDEIKANLKQNQEYYQASRPIDHKIEQGREETREDLLTFPLGEIQYADKEIPSYVLTQKAAWEADFAQRQAAHQEKMDRMRTQGQQTLNTLQIEPVLAYLKEVTAAFKDGQGATLMTRPVENHPDDPYLKIAAISAPDGYYAKAIITSGENQSISLASDSRRGQIYLIPTADTLSGEGRGDIQMIASTRSVLHPYSIEVATSSQVHEFSLDTDFQVTYHKVTETQREKTIDAPAAQIESYTGHQKGEPQLELEF